MSKKSGGKPAKAATDGPKIVVENRKARHKYEILDTLECGIVLQGSEVKSLRSGKVSLDEAYARVRDGEVWLIGCDIAEYSKATLWQHAPKRPRKLLLHKRELEKFANKAHEKGLTLTPLRIFFNARGIAKVVLALARGRKLFDKREAAKKADVKRDIQRVMRSRNRQ